MAERFVPVIAVTELAGDEVHDPAQDYGRTYEEREAVEAVAEHALGCFALGDAEDG